MANELMDNPVRVLKIEQILHFWLEFTSFAHFPDGETQGKALDLCLTTDRFVLYGKERVCEMRMTHVGKQEPCGSNCGSYQIVDPISRTKTTEIICIDADIVNLNVKRFSTAKELLDRVRFISRQLRHQVKRRRTIRDNRT